MPADPCNRLSEKASEFSKSEKAFTILGPYYNSDINVWDHGWAYRWYKYMYNVVLPRLQTLADPTVCKSIRISKKWEFLLQY